MKKMIFILGFIAIWIPIKTTSAEPDCSFMGLGFLPGGYTESFASGISGDGKVVIGHCGITGYRWTNETGMMPTTECMGGKISYDGSIIATTTRRWRAIQWTANKGVYSVVSDGIDVYSISNDICDDGSTIVGQTYGYGFIWKPGVSFNQIVGSKSVNGISSDGSIVVGEKFLSGSETEAFMLKSGQMTSLGRLPGSTNCKAHAISDDGKIIVGQSYWGSRNEAFLWTEQDGMIGLGNFPDEIGYDAGTWAKDISGDGKTVIGIGYTVLGPEAFIWDNSHGLRNLRLVLEQDYHLNLTGWILTNAESISDDGRVIVGYGTDPLGRREAWMAVIPEPGTFFLLLFGGVIMSRKKKYINQSFFPKLSPAVCSADIRDDA